METLTIETQDIHDAIHMGHIPPHYSAAETVLAKGGKVLLTNYGAHITEIKTPDELRSLTSFDGKMDQLRNEESMTEEAERLVASALMNAPFSVSFTVGGKAPDYRRIFNDVVKRQNAQVYSDTTKFIRFGRSPNTICEIEYLESPDTRNQNL
jgi:hypothetical protein